MILEALLYLHVAAGFTALVSAFIATITKALNTAHKWHICNLEHKNQ
jgi:hypothetical protein